MHELMNKTRGNNYALFSQLPLSQISWKSLNKWLHTTYHQHFVADDNFSISMRKSAFGNARYINAIRSIFEWW